MPRKIKIKYLNETKSPWIIEYGCAKTRFGDVQLGALNGAVCFLYFASSAQLKSNIKGRAQKRFPKAEFKENEAAIKDLIDKIFDETDDEIEIVLAGTEFQNCVWDMLLQIPKGDQWTYSECAERIGKPSAVRAVANAVANNEVSYLVPCHRVVSKDGNKLKYGWGPKLKKELLEHESKVSF